MKLFSCIHRQFFIVCVSLWMNKKVRSYLLAHTCGTCGFFFTLSVTGRIVCMLARLYETNQTKDCMREIISPAGDVKNFYTHTLTVFTFPFTLGPGTFYRRTTD